MQDDHYLTRQPIYPCDIVQVPLDFETTHGRLVHPRTHDSAFGHPV